MRSPLYSQNYPSPNFRPRHILAGISQCDLPSSFKTLPHTVGRVTVDFRDSRVATVFLLVHLSSFTRGSGGSMQGFQGHRFSAFSKNCWTVLFIVPLTVYYPNAAFPFCVNAGAADQVERLLNVKQLLTGDQSSRVWLCRAWGSFAPCSNTTISVEGRRSAPHFPTGNFSDNEDGRNDEFTHTEGLPTDADLSAGFAQTGNITGRRGRSMLSPKRGHKCRNPSLLRPQRLLTQKINPLRISGNDVKNREGRHLQSAEHEEEQQQQHTQKQYLDQSYQQQSKQQREHDPDPEPQGQEQPGGRFESRSAQVLFEGNADSNEGASDKYDKDSKDAAISEAGAREKYSANGSGPSGPLVTQEELKLQEVSGLEESLAKNWSAEVTEENEWKLIGESWKRAELLYNNPTAFWASGFQVYQRKDARRVIQAVLPFWTVDLLGALDDTAKTVALRASVAPPSPAGRPLRLGTGNAANDTLVEIGYTPSGQQNTYAFRWNGTQIVYSTGVDPTEAWPLERIGGKRTPTPTSHFMEVTRGDRSGKAFYDLSSRFYGHEINVGDVEMGVRHQFYDDTYNATPSNVVVRAQNYTVDIAADPTDTSYRIGVGEHETKVEFLRNFNEKRTAFRGDFMDWLVSWDSDAQDASSSTTSAAAVVGTKNEDPLLTAHVRRGAEGHYAEGDTQIQMRDIGMRMKWKKEGLTGDVKLGKIKYKFDMKEGLPDFTLTSS